MASTLYDFRRRTARALALLLAFAVFAFGAAEAWASALVAAGVGAVAAVWAWRMAREPFRLRLDARLAPFALLAAVAAAQAAAGGTADPHRTAAAASLWALYLVWALLWAQILDDVTLRETVSRAAGLLGGALALLSLAQRAVFPDRAYGLRATADGAVYGPFASRGEFVALLLLLYPAALYWSFRDRQRKLAARMAAGLMALAMVAAGSPPATVLLGIETLAVGVAVLLWSERPSPRRRALRKFAAAGVVALLAAVGAAGVIWPHYTGGAYGLGGVRLHAAVGAEALALTAERAFTGHGAGAFAAAFASRTPTDGFRWLHAEMDPLALAVEFGVWGLAAQAAAILFLLAGQRSARTWATAVLPLAAMWTGSWLSAPLGSPAVVLAALILYVLALTDPRLRGLSTFERS